MTTEKTDANLRLLVISYLHLPDTCGGAAIFSDLCMDLAKRGMDVTVRSAVPHYPEWTDKSGKNSLRVARSVENGVKVERFGLFIPRNPRSMIQRLLYEGTFFLSLCRTLLSDRKKFDCVMALCPLGGSVAYAGLLKIFHGFPVYLNVQDLPADAAAASGMNRMSLGKSLLKNVQATLFNFGDVWSSISPVMVERLETIRRRNQPIFFVPNWLHEGIAKEIQRLPSKIGRAPSNPIKLLYAGNIGMKQGLLDFCQELAKTPAPFEFRIHGNGGAAGEVESWVESSGDRRFSFGPILSEEKFVQALHDTDVFVITEKSGSGASFFPSKTVPGMASGSVIMAVSDPDSPLGREVREQNLGPFLTWDQINEVGNVVASIPCRSEDFATWQRNSLKRSNHFNRESILDSVESNLRKLASRSPVTAQVESSSLPAVDSTTVPENLGV